MGELNRRRFLELMGKGLAGSAVVYSFPSIIVPKNIVRPVYLHEPGNTVITFPTPADGQTHWRLAVGRDYGSAAIPYIWLEVGLESLGEQLGMDPLSIRGSL